MKHSSKANLQQQAQTFQAQLAASQDCMPHFWCAALEGMELCQHDGHIVSPGQVDDLHHLCQTLGNPSACIAATSYVACGIHKKHNPHTSR